MNDKHYAGSSGFAKATLAERVCSAFAIQRDYPVKGVDISKWQGAVDFAKMRDKGITFVIIRAGSCGPDGPYEDSRFREYVAGARAAGLYTGHYWFLRTDYDVKAQANYFADLLKSVEYDIFPVADVEHYYSSPSTMRARVLEFLDRVSIAVGEACGVYTAPSWWNSHVERNWRFADFPLWIAHWGVAEPTVPLDWKNTGKTWTFWQTHVGKDGPDFGVSSQGLDHDVYNGTLPQFLAQFGEQEQPPTPPAELPASGDVTIDFGSGIVYRGKINLQ